MIRSFNTADWILIAILLVSTLISIKRGLAREVLSLLGILLAFIVALSFSEPLALILANWISTPSIRIIVAILGLFAITMIVMAMLNHLIADFLKKTGLTGTDRLFGMVFGFIRGLVVVMAFVILCKASFQADPWWQQSRLIPAFLTLEDWSLKVWGSISYFFNQLLEKL